MTHTFDQLEVALNASQATTRPVPSEMIIQAEQQLGLDFGATYREYLRRFGVIVHGSTEVYGLGVPEDYYLNVLVAYDDLAQDASYPLGALPLVDEGDGHYYLYDTTAKDIVLWAMPNGGIVRRVSETLDAFLLKRLVQDQSM